MGNETLNLKSIPGWLPERDQQLFTLLLARQSSTGDIAELGAYLGKTSVLLGAHLRPDETLTVVDLFETPADDSSNKQENDLTYGSLTRTAFENNYLRFHPSLPQVISGPSELIVDYASKGTHRFVHIDASHLYNHVRTDLQSAMELAAENCVIVLDDYRMEHTPGVAAAVWEAVANDGLKPFALTPRKFYGTWGDAAGLGRVVEEWARRRRAIADIQEVSGTRVVRVKDVPTGVLALSMQDYLSVIKRRVRFL